MNERFLSLCNIGPDCGRLNNHSTPVVVLITNPDDLVPRLNNAEVDALFSHPLESFLVCALCFVLW